ncbi:FTR1 family iron permease [Campylobacter pinnipediorum subsp. pinnipediorum]|uniref:FTR1 family iron permease n=1 Tax=Campylobacter pinnipediorum subsp. pinnipediorum TaxID=1660067 RepID=A0AAX0LCK5_9BACT|nr:FTR1 family protein [Campylobacter pinnipediorum]OPA82155.1 FTR1 family iron permease [Campylobacter pinnipediorum subsp. pinnipediorum]
MKKIIVFLFLLFAPLILTAKSDDFAKTTQDIKDALNVVIKEYEAGNVDKAKTDVQNAYFGLFEDIEGAIRINLSAKKAYLMEKQFGDIRKAIKKGETVAQIQSRVDKLSKELDEVLPVILNGHKLVGEYSDTSENQQDIAELDSQNFAPEWKFVFENIKNSLELAKQNYQDDKKEEAKKAVEDTKFVYYRNTKLEEAVRKYADKGQSLDGDIQRKMNEAIVGTKNSITKDDFDTKIDHIISLTHSAISKLPAEATKIADVKLPDDFSDEGNGTDFTSVVVSINTKMQQALDRYLKGEIDGAMGDAQDIYFDDFEASGMENKIGAINVNLKTTIEASFGSVVSLMKSGANKESIQEALTKLDSQLKEALELTSTQSSPWTLFVWSLTIILREGFEALIIVAAVVSYLLKTGNATKMNKIVYSSIITAVVLSFVMAYAMNLIFAQAAGQKRELFEGITMLVAVGFLFYVGFWLLSNAGAKKWSAYIQSNITQSLTSNSIMALWWTVFLAVFREGAETVLFYQALIFDAKDSAPALAMIGSGFVVGLVILLVVYFVFKIFAVKIPIKPFFIFTSAIIFYMSIVFVGKGIMELVEGKIFVPTIIDGLHFPPFFNSWLGFYAYYETLIPQIIMILSLVFGIFIMKKKQIQ